MKATFYSDPADPTEISCDLVNRLTRDLLQPSRERTEASNDDGMGVPSFVTNPVKVFRT